LGFELEADATIPAEYILLKHYLGEPVDPVLEQKIAAYLRRIQGAHGGWPLFHEGEFNISASVKAYFALKMVGEPIDAPHMVRARGRFFLAGCCTFQRLHARSAALHPDWRSVPEMPVEIVLLPRWFPFHLSKVSYWARTVLVPLLVLQALRPRAKNPLGVRIDELFVEPPASIGPAPKAPHQHWSWFLLFRGIDAILRPAVKLFPKSLRQRAINRAVDFATERLNGEDGLGAIFPAMANATLMYDVLGDG
jgi:squalene-hopene/tetraprenyl-beta-curcumene cyclase